MQGLRVDYLVVQSVVGEVLECEVALVVRNGEVLSEIADDLSAVGLVEALLVLLLKGNEETVHVLDQLRGSLFDHLLVDLLINLVELLQVRLSLLLLLVNQADSLLQLLLQFLVESSVVEHELLYLLLFHFLQLLLFVLQLVEKHLEAVNPQLHLLQLSVHDGELLFVDGLRPLNFVTLVLVSEHYTVRADYRGTLVAIVDLLQRMLLANFLVVLVGHYLQVARGADSLLLVF